MRKILLVFLAFLSIASASFGQACSTIQVWSAANRGGSGLYNTGENVRLPGGTSFYTPRYGSTTCHLTDGWCRDEASAGWRQWRKCGDSAKRVETVQNVLAGRLPCAKI